MTYCLIDVIPDVRCIVPIKKDILLVVVLLGYLLYVLLIGNRSNDVDYLMERGLRILLLVVLLMREEHVVIAD